VKQAQRIFDRYGVEGFDRPRLTPRHPRKKGVVVTKVNGRAKVIRFGAHGYPHNYSAKARTAFKKRHAVNIRRGRQSAAYWSDKVLWAGKGGHTVTPAQARRRRLKQR
jgi:hypothetical protein